ncbi:MAG: hypothetical protein ABI670_17080 [Chloroflexota bacterium]
MFTLMAAPTETSHTDHNLASTLDQAAEDYEELAASLSALLDELAGGRTGTHLVRHLDGQIALDPAHPTPDTRSSL